MSLLRHEGDKTGVVTRAVEVLRDDLCVRGRASKVLRVEYSTCEGKESEPDILALDPTVQTRRPQGEEVQTNQGDEETRM